MDKIKGCPFCKHKTTSVVGREANPVGYSVAVDCGNCGCLGPVVIVLRKNLTVQEKRELRRQAIAAWNRRSGA